jgi:hypothetical protein
MLMRIFLPAFSTGMRSAICAPGCAAQYARGRVRRAWARLSVLHRLDQVVDRMHFECVQREFAVCGDEDNGGRVIQVLQGVGQLHARGLRHVHVQEHDVARIFLQFLNCFANTCCFGHDLGLSDLVQQILELGTGGSLIVDDHCFWQH